MKLQLDIEKFEELQTVLVEELVKTIKFKLAQAELDAALVDELTAGLAFNVACLIDGTAAIDSDEIDFRPFLAFQVGDEELVHCGENAYAHEFVHKALEKFAS